MNIEQVKAFLEFEEKQIVDFYLETVNLKKEERKQIQYILDGTLIKEIAKTDSIEERTADDRRRKACEKLAVAWSGRRGVSAIANRVIEDKRNRKSQSTEI